MKIREPISRNVRNLKLALFCILLAAAGTGRAGEMLKADDMTPVTAEALMRMVKESIAATSEKRPANYDIPEDGPVRNAWNGVQVILVKDGQVLASAVSRQTKLIGNIRVASARAAAQAKAEGLPQAAILLSVLFEEKSLNGIPPMPQNLRDASALGVHGFAAKYRGMEAFVPPLEAIIMDKSHKDMALSLAATVSPSDKENPNMSEETTRLIRLLASPMFNLSLVPSVTIALLPGKDKPEILYRAGKILPVTAITPEAIDQSLELAAKWYETNVDQNGILPYSVNPVTGDRSDDGSVVRKLMNLMALGRLWKETGKDNIRQIGLKNLKYLLEKYYFEDPRTGFGYIRDEESVTLGAAAAALLGIIHLDAQKDEPEILRKAGKIVMFITALRHGNGRYSTTYPDDGSDSNVDYYPGEAQLALMEWARIVHDEKLAKLCYQSMLYYRDYFGKTRNAPFIPWHTQANVMLYYATKRQEAADFIFEMNDLLVLAQQINPINGQFLAEDSRGRFINPKKIKTAKEHITTTGVYVEGIAPAFSLARKLGEEKRASDYRRAIFWGLRNVMQQQIKDDYDLLFVKDPTKAMGGFRTRPANADIRIDNMQHVVCALLNAKKALAAEDYLVTKELAGE